MNNERLEEILRAVAEGRMGVEDARVSLGAPGYEDLGFASVDHSRGVRQGFPEVIFCQGKATNHIVRIAESLSRHGENVMATRASREVFDAVAESIPDSTYYEEARIVVVKPREIDKQKGVLVVSGGTSDMPVAEEAAVTAEVMGNQVERLYDVGVAGIHRLLSRATKLYEARVLIVVAGMEGALASVVGGLVDKPVVAVPTSIGYGAHFNGLASLLAMLNSCASGVTVVNIDNGFGAGYAASLINRL